MPVPLTDKHLQALQAGEVFRTYNRIEFKITGPCSSKLLWSLAGMGLIADPLDGNLHGRHCMVLTAKGLAALGLADTEDAEPDIDTGFRIISGSSTTLPLGRCEIYRRRRISGSMRIADLELASREVREVPIVLKKSFWGDERKFLEPLMRFAAI